MSRSSSLLEELERHFDAFEQHRRQMHNEELAAWILVDRLRSDGVPWRSILFAMCRGRGISPKEATELSRAARKRLHDFRRQQADRVLGGLARFAKSRVTVEDSIVSKDECYDQKHL